MRQPFRIAAIGELLWDLLPGGPQLGGAPANFASLAANLEEADSAGPLDEIFLISRVGDDPLGHEAFERLRRHHVISDFISIDPKHATGSVNVFHADTGPTYQIHENMAWDFVPQTPSLAALAPTLDAICFGTLAQRSPVTRETLRRTVEATHPNCLRVFDVNLRQLYWNAETLFWGCEHATILKMNEEESSLVAEATDLTAQTKNPVDIAHLILRRFPINLVAVTRGAHGCLLVTSKMVYDHPGAAVDVIDSVGAGDAFTAALTFAVLCRQPLPAVTEAANYWGGWVATQRGGMPLPARNTRSRVH